jgi:hypothetical protein
MNANLELAAISASLATFSIKGGKKGSASSAGNRRTWAESGRIGSRGQVYTRTSEAKD